MAKQIGSTFIGTVDGLSCYYNRLHGYLVRQTGGVTSKEYHKDSRYEAARDNSKEFCVVSSTGKLIREALGEFLRPVKDGTMVNRLNKELVALKQQDRTHFRGERRPDVMMTNEEANLHFRIFQFNDRVKLYDLLESVETGCACPPSLSAGAGWVPSNACTNQIRLKTSAFPEGATHAGITLVRTVIDFATGTYRTVSSRMTVISKESVETGFIPSNDSGFVIGMPALSDVSVAGTGGQTEITCLQILFFKERNGDLVQVKGKVHSMGILSVNHILAPIQNQTSKIQNQLAHIKSVETGCFLSLCPDAGASILLVPVPKRTLRRRPKREYKRVLRGEDRHVYVQLAGSSRNERGYFIIRDGEKVFV